MGNLLVYKGRIPSSTPSSKWVRPEDWLPIPTPGTQEVIGLMAVYDDGSNYVALQCTGAYTVDWGDGTITNYASNTVASYQHTFSSLSPSTLTTQGFRQAMVRITPQAGQNLTSVAFGVTNTTLGKGFAPGWLEFDARIPNSTITWLGGSNIIRYARLEKITIRELGAQNPQNLFTNLFNLKSVYIEPSEMTGRTLFNNMFQACYSLVEVNAFDVSSGTNFNSMFASCYNLTNIPLFNFSSATSMTQAFSGCYSLETLPALTLRGDITQIFLNCNNLKEVAVLNTSAVTNFTGMFQNCTSLENVPLINTSVGTNFTSMFAGCNSLTEIPLLNTSNATNMTGMFNGAQSIMYLPTLNTANVTTVAQMFNNCYNLRELPAFSLPVCTNFSSWILNNTTLSKSNVVNPTRGHSYSNMSLSTANIVIIFTNLGTASGAQTITVSNNPGYAALTPTERLIATGKGWTIA